MRLILASTSPRRAQILRDAGFVFELAAPNVNEDAREGEGPPELARRLAVEKARAVGTRDGAIVIGADTVIELDGAIIGKPVDAADAGRILRLLSGRTHEVITGVAVLAPQGEPRVEHETTRVTFAAMSDAEIASYIASGEPFGKAGAYAIQGIGGRYVTRIEGCYFNVMGLPLARLYGILREMETRATADERR